MAYWGYAKDTLLTGNRRRCARIEGTRKVPSLHPPLPARQDAKAPQDRGVHQPGRGRPGIGLLLGSVPQVVRELQEGRSPGASKEQGQRARPSGAGHARSLRGASGGHEAGEIATISQADEFLRERHGIEYANPDGVGQLLRRRKVKKKTGRPRHEEADQKEQEAVKKTSPPRSSGRALATTNR